MSADTIIPQYSDPQTLNRYTYVRNNPLRFTDPTGFWQCAAGNQDIQNRCINWVTDLLEMLKDEGSEVSLGVYRWFTEHDQTLIEARGFGVTFSVERFSLFGFSMAARGNDTIKIRQSYLNQAVSKSKAALLGHEIVHLYQIPANAFSDPGERGAYYVQAKIRSEFGLNSAQSLETIESIVDSVAVFGESDIETMKEALLDINGWYRLIPNEPPTIYSDVPFGQLPTMNDYYSGYSELVVEPVRFFSSLGSVCYP